MSGSHLPNLQIHQESPQSSDCAALSCIKIPNPFSCRDLPLADFLSETELNGFIGREDHVGVCRMQIPFLLRNCGESPQEGFTPRVVNYYAVRYGLNLW